MKWRTLRGAVLLVALAHPGVAAATPPAAEDTATVTRKGLKVTLVTDRDAATPGQTLRLGVRFELEPHWHIYWKEPYGPGKSTVVDLDAPDGYALGAMAWPTPVVIGAGTSFTGWGYEGETVLYAEAKVPAGALEGERAAFRASVKWLACEKECIPGKATLALSLPIKTGAGRSAAADAFDAAAARLPGDAPPWLQIEVVRGLDQHPAGGPFQMAVTAVDREGKALTEGAIFAAPEEGLALHKAELKTAGPGVPAGGFGVGLAGQVQGGAAGDDLEAVLTGKRDGQPFYVALALPVPRVMVSSRSHVLFPPVAGPVAPATEGAGQALSSAPAMSVAPNGKPARPQICPAGAQRGAAGAPGLLWLLLLALGGGLILNIMPCVLPVLSIKVLGIVQQSGENRRRTFLHGVAYAVGVYACFAVLGIFMLALSKGWGFQFQSAGFTATMGAMVLAFGLSLFGVFELELPGANALGTASTGKHGYFSSFTNGAFAVLLGTACTAPVLGPALAAASTQPVLEQALILFAIASGFHLPFLLLAMVPAWRRLLPRPGPWMDTFKKIMGFFLIGTAIFFVGVLRGQVSAEGYKLYLAFLGVLSFACWVYGHWGSPMNMPSTRWIAMLSALVLTAGSGWWLVRLDPPASNGGSGPTVASSDGAAVVDGHIQWRSFVAQDPYEHAKNGRTVFVDFTADWCVNCKTIESTVLDTDEVKAAMQAANVLPLQADWTIEDPEITYWLECFKGKASVPMYLVIPAGRPDDAYVLPEWPSTDDVVGAFQQAGGNGQLAQVGAPAVK